MGLAVINLCTKFEIFLRIMKIWTAVPVLENEVIRGHWRSLAVSPFDGALWFPFQLSCTVFENMAYLSGGILQRSLAPVNWGPWPLMWCCLRDRTFSHFSRTLTCDRHRQTRGHSIYCTSITSHSKSVLALWELDVHFVVWFVAVSVCKWITTNC